MNGPQETRTYTREAPSLGQPLTQRETEVARLVVEGHPNRRIAGQLGITEQTVKNHLTAMFDKTGTSSRVQLALHCVRADRPQGTPEAAALSPEQPNL